MKRLRTLLANYPKTIARLTLIGWTYLLWSYVTKDWFDGHWAVLIFYLPISLFASLLIAGLLSRFVKGYTFNVTIFISYIVISLLIGIGVNS